MAHIIFVGGDSRQERAVSRLIQKGALEDLKVVFHHPTPWSRNWDKWYDAVKRNISSASALVITSDVPTELGHSLRRLARDRGVRWFGVPAPTVRPQCSRPAKSSEGRCHRKARSMTSPVHTHPAGGPRSPSFGSICHLS